MAKHIKTLRLVEAAQEILAEHHPMTLRQLYYQLVSSQVIKNNRGQYQAASRAIVDARCEGIIPWEWIEDRLRRPRTVSMWDDLQDFAQTALASYRRDVWASQPAYVEVWLEKDALSGIFEDVLDNYGVTLNVGRGYDGWSSIRNAAMRYVDAGIRKGRIVTILYFGDLDPSGEDMVRSLRERLGFFDCRPQVIKCALTAEDVTRYKLPADFTKPTDTRQAAYVAQYGNIAVELDALPVDVLEERLRAEIESRIDLAGLEAVRKTERKERRQLAAALKHKRRVGGTWGARRRRH